ncbi:MAG: hypothetical protein P1V36_03615 [Planctomycetota bacterium]|nr:hypothetical protein [Planctomycetota bacterium]
MSDDANPFELVDDDSESAPKKPAPEKPATKKPAPAEDADGLPALELEPDLEAAPAPAAQTAAAPGGADEVEEIQLDDKPPPTPEPTRTIEDEGPTDGSTVRMSLSDVVSAWGEEAPEGAAAAAAAAEASTPTKDRSAAKRIAIMVLVIVAVLAVIIVLFASCTPVAHADELEGMDETDALLASPSDIGIDFRGIEEPPRLQRPENCCWRPWRLLITPYGFLASVKGDVYADAESQSIKIDFEDILDRTSAGGMLNVVFGYKRWKFVADGLFARLGDDLTVGRTNVAVKIRQYQLELAVGRRVIGPAFGEWVGPRCCPPVAPCPRQTLDLVAGMRYGRTETVLTINRPAGGILTALSKRATNTEDYWEPFVGGTWQIPLNRRWSFGFRGDVGGFAIGRDASNFSWRLEAVTQWRFHRRLALLFGWRVFEQDRTNGSGPDKEGTKLLQHGPLIGLMIRI